MLVDPDQHSIDDHVFEVGITGHRLEHLLEHAFQCPSPEAPLRQFENPLPGPGLAVIVHRPWPVGTQEVRSDRSQTPENQS
jgi:hypothetical protein